MSVDIDRAPASRTLEPGAKPALLIVDFVRAYLTPDPRSTQASRPHTTRPSGCSASRGEAGIPMMHSNVVYEPGGRDGGVFFRKLPALASFERGRHPELAAFAAGLEPLPGEPVFSKQYASAFFGNEARRGAQVARGSTRC